MMPQPARGRGPTVVAGLLFVASTASLVAMPQAPAPDNPGGTGPRAPQQQTSQPKEPSPEELRRGVLDVEDARDTSPAGLGRIAEALKSKDTETRRVAVRALGRMEQPALARTIGPVLLDPAPVVRAEACNALAQVTAAEGGDLAFGADLLHAQLERESHPVVRGSIGEALGRLPYKSVDQVRRAERALVDIARGAGLDKPDPSRSAREIPAERVAFAPPSTLLNVLRGFESLARLQANMAPPESTTVGLLKELAVAWRSAVARAEGGPTAEAAARIRRLATAALVSANAADAAAVSTAFGDADDQVRRLGALGAAALDPPDEKLIERGVRDTAPVVRTSMLVALGRRPHRQACGYASVLLRDPDTHVATSAFDVAGRTCAGNAGAIAAIAAAAGRLPAFEESAEAPADRARSRTEPFGLFSRTARSPTWHASSHALVALAQLAPDQLDRVLDQHVTDRRWQVRMYAARAAGVAKRATPLATLASDENANVRDAALAALQQARGHDADDTFIAALAGGDDQLIITAAKALEGTPRKQDAAAALFAALKRVTAQQRDTSRDARTAILARLQEVAGRADVDTLRPYLQDFDPVIAARAAGILSGWTGAPAVPQPKPIPRAPLPTSSEVDSLGATKLTITVRGVGRFEVRLLASEAPLNAWRVARLARHRFYDGLTFHRVVPAFVLQGGSPGANEYAGDALFTRDELGQVSNARGSLGVSTRGRDTGDGQVYINLIDNPRLDHTYTVFGQIEKGLEVIDAILEGDVIETVEVGVAEAR